MQEKKMPAQGGSASGGKTIRVENLLIKAENRIRGLMRALWRHKLKLFIALLGVVAATGGAIYAAGVFNISAPASVAAKGLIGYWPLDSASMKTASTTADLTPNANDGTLYGRALADRLTTNRKTVANGAMSFDGSSDYVDTGTTFDFDNNFTVSFWATNLNTHQDAKGLFTQTDSGSYITDQGFSITTISSPDSPYIWIVDDSANIKLLDTGLGEQYGWTHFVVTRTDDTIKFYKQGAQYGSDLDISTLGSINGDQNCFIGKGNAGSYYGSIDEVRIYNYALTEAEITKLYDAYKPKVAGSSLEKGLIGHWSLDNKDMKSASTTADLTPYANDGTLYGRALADRLTTDRKIVANKAMSFDGVGDYVNCGNDASIKFNRSTNFSWSFWIKPNDLSPTYQSILSEYDSANFKWFGLQNSSGISGRIRFDYGNSYDFTDVGVVTENQWHHLVLTHIAGTNNYLIYVDGILKDTLVSTGSGVNTNNILLGISTSSLYPFTGSIDEVRIYNYALTEAEITKLYDAYKPKVAGSSLEKGLIGHWSLDNKDMKSASTTADLTPYSNDGTLYGRALADRLTTNRKTVANKAMSFNGSGDYVDISANNFLDTFPLSFTASFWFNLNQAYDSSESEDQKILAKINDESPIEAFDVHLEQVDGTLTFQVYRNNVQVTAISSQTTSWTAGVWHHVVAGWENNGDSYLYIDGVSQTGGDSGVLSPQDGSTRDFVIGANTWGGSNDEYFNGTIDEVRIYNRVLSAEEVRELYERY